MNGYGKLWKITSRTMQAVGIDAGDKYLLAYF
jgi:hypothetical protein